MLGALGGVVLEFGKVLAAEEKAKYKNLNHAGASLRKTAIESIVFTKEFDGWRSFKRGDGKGRRKRMYKSAPVGSPIFGHRNRSLFRRGIKYDVTADTAVIGPAASILGQVMELHEFGGERYGHHYEPRPVMGPALDKNIDRFAASWQSSIGE
jgi:hypothetical protein